MKTDYRKVWEEVHGPIPVDGVGRTYEIHHIDGDRNNNSIENLMCVSIQEHYNIHLRQGDYGAGLAIVMRMKLSPEKTSKMISEMNQEKIRRGEHNFQDPEHQKMLAENRKQRINDGTHNFSGDNNPARKKKASGELLWNETVEGRKIVRQNTLNQKNNVFRDLERHPLKTKWKCIVTNKVSTKTGFTKMAKNKGLDKWPHELIKEMA